MEPKENKKWESGPRQETDDKRTKEQIDRAKQEANRRNENLEEADGHPEGSYKEKNGDEDQQFSDLDNEPKLDDRKTHPNSDN